MNKRIISGAAALAMVLSGAGALPEGTFAGVSFDILASAETIVDSGTTYSGLSYKLYSDGTLILSGDSDVDSYDISWDMSAVKHIIIEEGITGIGYHAFYGCTTLQSITIPKSVTYIGTKAFGFYSKDSTDVKMDNLKIICYGGTEAASYVYNNKFTKFEITDVDEGEDRSWIFDSETGVLIVRTRGEAEARSTYWDREDIKKVIIENGATSISYSGFGWCPNLEEVVIPESVTWIDHNAFNSCTNLKKINIPSGVTDIGMSAFEGCTSLKELSIPEGVQHIDSYAFEKSCKLFCKIGSVAHEYAVLNNLDYELFEDSLPSGTCEENLSWSFDKYSTLTISGNGRLEGDYHLHDAPPWDKIKREWVKSVVIENGVTSIGSSVFDNCYNLKSITFPDSITSIHYAFDSCALEKVFIPANVSWIDSFCFHRCHNLSMIEVDENNPYYYSKDGVLFSRWRELMTYPANKPGESYEIPYGIRAISNYSFSYCNNLKEVTIPETVTQIIGGAFSDCSNLETINIPSSVTEIGGRDCFEGTKWLKNKQTENPLVIVNNIIVDGTTCEGDVIVPENVTSICSFAFQNCENITSINLPNGLTNIGSSAFANYDTRKNSKISYFNIPNTVTIIGSAAFFNSPLIKSVVIPASVESIGQRAFGYCYKIYDDHIDLTSSAYTKIDGFKIYCYKDTAGEKYAIDNGFDYELLKDTYTAQDVLDACSEAGIDSLNRQSLSDMLTKNEGKFTSEDFADFIVAFKEIARNHIASLANDMYPGKSLSNLTDEERLNVLASLSNEARTLIRTILNDTAAAHKIKLTFGDNGEGGTLVTGELVGEQPNVVPGDVTGNNKVDGEDLARLQQYVAGWNVTVETDTGDVTGDGKVNGEDIALVQKYLAGWNVTLGQADA